jgi:hypothetical protein
VPNVFRVRSVLLLAEEGRFQVATTPRFTAVGAFAGRPQAERAIQELQLAGFTLEQIGIAVRNNDVPEPPPAKGDVSANVEKGAATGAAAGAALGAVTGAAATGLIPGVGPVLATGLMAGILGGTALGAAAGGLVGALVGIGLPDADAEYYDRAFMAGQLIIAVRAGSRSAEAAAILRRCGAVRASFAPDIPASGGRQPPERGASAP